MSISIRAVKSTDIEALDEAMPTHGGHRARLRAHNHGEVTYLLAFSVSTGQPVGHVMIRWRGSVHGHMRKYGQPEIARLAVHPEMRGRQVGGKLLESAEALIQAADRASVGLAVGVDNPAKGLYMRHGYEPVGDPFSSPHGPNGKPHLVQYMEKSLAAELTMDNRQVAVISR